MLAVNRFMISYKVVALPGAKVELGLNTSNHTVRAVPLVGAKPGQNKPGEHGKHIVVLPTEKLPGAHGVGMELEVVHANPTGQGTHADVPVAPK